MRLREIQNTVILCIKYCFSPLLVTFSLLNHPLRLDFTNLLMTTLFWFRNDVRMIFYYIDFFSSAFHTNCRYTRTCLENIIRDDRDRRVTGFVTEICYRNSLKKKKSQFFLFFFIIFVCVKLRSSFFFLYLTQYKMRIFFSAILRFKDVKISFKSLFLYTLTEIQFCLGVIFKSEICLCELFSVHITFANSFLFLVFLAIRVTQLL